MADRLGTRRGHAASGAVLLLHTSGMPAVVLRAGVLGVQAVSPGTRVAREHVGAGNGAYHADERRMQLLRDQHIPDRAGSRLCGFASWQAAASHVYTVQSMALRQLPPAAGPDHMRGVPGVAANGAAQSAAGKDRAVSDGDRAIASGGEPSHDGAGSRPLEQRPVFASAEHRRSC